MPMPENTPKTRTADAPRPPYYDTIPLPTRLLDDLHDTPQAIGIYALIGRLYLIEQQPIPLSASDVARYDPSLSRGAIIRALDRLERGGWLMVVSSGQPGRKNVYLPAWGRARKTGGVRPWDLTAPRMGRTSSMRLHRLAFDLLDDGLGRIAPHQTRKARVQREQDTPQLTLTQIGQSALVGNHTQVPTIDPQSLPDTTRLRSAGGSGAPAQAGIGTPNSPRASLFSLVSLIGILLGTILALLIGKLSAINLKWEQQLSALQQGEPPKEANASNKQGIQGNHDDSGDSIPPTHPAAKGGGNRHGQKKAHQPGQPDKGCAAPAQTCDNAATSEPTEPQTETEKLLRAHGVSHKCARELADVDYEQASAVVYRVKQRQGLRSPQGLIVKLLRQQKTQTEPVVPPIMPPAPKLFEAYQTAQDIQAAPETQAAPEPVQMGQEPAEAALSIPEPVEPADDAPAPALPRSPILTCLESGDLDTAWDLALEQIRAQVMRLDFEVFADTRLLRWDGEYALVGCPTVEQKVAIEDTHMARVRLALRVRTVQIVVAAPPPWDGPARSDRDDQGEEPPPQVAAPVPFVANEPCEPAPPIADLTLAWFDALESLCGMVTPRDYDVLFRPSRLVRLNENEAIIGCQTVEQKEQIENWYMPLLRHVLQVGTVRIVLVSRDGAG